MTEVFIKQPHKDRKLFRAEKRILEHLPEHPGLPKLIGVNDRDGRIILEKIEGITLYDYREEHRRHFPKCLKIATGISSVVAVLHQAGVVHNDLSYNNVMLRGRQCEPVIVDFQDSFKLGREYKMQRSLRGLEFFLAPEKYLGPRPFACLKSDIYSLGAIIYYTITGSPQSETLLTDHNYPKQLRNIVEKCLSPSPRLRPRVDEVIKILKKLV